MNKVYKQIFLDNLPHKGKLIDWKQTIGYTVKFIYDDIKGNVKIIDYNKDTKHLTINYNNKNYQIHVTQFCRGGLGMILNKYNFRFNIGDIIKSKNNDLIIINRFKDENDTYCLKKYKYYCNKCGYNGIINEYNLLNGCGCSVCSGHKAILGMNTIWDTNRWMCDLGVSEDDAKKYTKESNHKIFPICPNCGKKREKPISISTIYRCRSIGCQCHDHKSYPNKFSYALLNQLNNLYHFTELEHEYSPKWIKPKRYDNYFEYNGNKYILEMDGGFHNKDNSMSGQTKEKSKEIDLYKDKLAKEHNIKVIRIDCDYKNNNAFEYLKNNLIHSQLSDIFNLSIIDWVTIDKFALQNLVKMVCAYYNKYHNLTPIQIANHFNICKNSVKSYLKIGNNYNWCNYHIIKQKHQSHSNKPVEILKDNKSIVKFKSLTELSKQSEKMFNVSLNVKDISKNLHGYLHSYKGFTFKFITYQEYEEYANSVAKEGELASWVMQ